MSNAIKFIKDLIAESILNLHTAMPCKVISYDTSSKRAKIQPLFKKKEIGMEPETLAPIDDVPVLFHRFQVDDSVQTYSPLLQAGDIVLAVFCERAIDDALDGKVIYPDVNRAHDIHDAVIVGVIA